MFSRFCVLFVLGLLHYVGAFVHVSLRRKYNGMRAVFSTPNSVEVKNIETLIIGSGLAGLSCANGLQRGGNNDFLVVESASICGGRVQTEVVKGFRLDKGFQVFIDSYPLARQTFDYSKLQLQAFLPGAQVHVGGEFYLVSDPLRRPQDLIATLFNPVGSLADKIKIGIVTLTIPFSTLKDIFDRNEMSTSDYLKLKVGLSDSMVDKFFKPFYQGIFLSRLEEQSSRMFEFVFKMFTQGSATLPLLGMQEIGAQLAAKLPSEAIVYNTRVTEIVQDNLSDYLVKAESSNGEVKSYRCRQVVIAADPVAAQQLVANLKLSSKDKQRLEIDLPKGRSSTCVYFGFNGAPPVLDPILILNGDNDLSDTSAGRDPLTINNVCFPSQVSAEYAPPGKSLASVTIVGDVIMAKRDAFSSEYMISDEMIESAVRRQLKQWWRDCAVEEWEFLKVYRIPYAQPAQIPPYETELRVKLDDSNGLYCCGDHRSTATLNGAIDSGDTVARLILSSHSRLSGKLEDRL